MYRSVESYSVQAGLNPRLEVERDEPGFGAELRIKRGLASGWSRHPTAFP